jgi:hypothetical protein
MPIHETVHRPAETWHRNSHCGVHMHLTSPSRYLHVGPEIGVASTKAFTGQVMVLTMFALLLAKERGTVDDAEMRERLQQLADLPASMSKVLLQRDNIIAMAKTFRYAQNFLFLGRGYNFPVALEGALKLKEISYIHAEGYVRITARAPKRERERKGGRERERTKSLPALPCVCFAVRALRCVCSARCDMCVACTC